MRQLREALADEAIRDFKVYDVLIKAVDGFDELA